MKTQLSAFADRCLLSPFWMSGIIHSLLNGMAWNVLYSGTWRTAMLAGRVGVRYVP